MTTFEAMRNRKSVRSYQAKPVEQDKIRAIVEAGNMAAGTPMAGKVYFSVITNAQVLDSIVTGSKEVMSKSGVPMLEKIASNPNFNPIYGAPVAVVISTDKADNPNTAGMARANAACAGENILLAATELGLGSCYLESPTLAFNIPTIAEAARIPANAQAQAVIVFGYTDDVAPHKEYPENPDNIVYVG